MVSSHLPNGARAKLYPDSQAEPRMRGEAETETKGGNAAGSRAQRGMPASARAPCSASIRWVFFLRTLGPKLN